MTKRRKDPLKPGTKAWEARQARHRHNALLGSLGMAKVFCHTIIHLPTTSKAAKQRAAGLLNELLLLKIDLKQRIDVL